MRSADIPIAINENIRPVIVFMIMYFISRFLPFPSLLCCYTPPLYIYLPVFYEQLRADKKLVQW
jgi:hypothetical protein